MLSKVSKRTVKRTSNKKREREFEESERMTKFLYSNIPVIVGFLTVDICVDLEGKLESQDHCLGAIREGPVVSCYDEGGISHTPPEAEVRTVANET